MIALTMIALGLDDEPPKMRRAIESVIDYVDAVYITLTGPRDLMGNAEQVLRAIREKSGKKIEISYEREKSLWVVTQEEIDWLKEFLGWEPESKVGDTIFLFDVARNYNMAQVPKEYDWLLWFDCDDIFRGGENLKKIVEDASKEGMEAIYLNYIYEAEIEGNKIKNVIIEHLRERIITNNGAYKWIAPIHETLIEQRPTNKKDYQDCDILHLAEISKRLQSVQRNIKALEYSIFQTQGKDPRPLYYLAKALYDRRNSQDDRYAAALMYAYLYGENKSGWPEERSQACEYLCEIYRRNGFNDKAIEECFNALKENVSPTGFLNLATSYMVKQDWERALVWLKVAAAIEGKKTTLVINPKDMQGKALEVLYNAHLNLHHVDEAWAAAVKLIEMYPNDPSAIKALQFIEMIRQERDVTKSVMHLADYLKRSGEPQKIKPLLAAVPQIAGNNPFTVDLWKKNYPPKYWEDNEVVIYCGPGFTNWSPKQLSDPKGSFVGGSEEAVILLSREVTKLGWKVTVYNDPGQDEGEYDGVKYLPYYKFNNQDHFNILVSWRQPEFIDQIQHAQKIYVWCHDILNPLQFTKERVDKLTKVIVLSPWHRSNIPDVPDNKILISSNGIW